MKRSSPERRLPDQVLTTRDGRKVVVKTLVVYKTRNVVQAVGKVNWDVDTTINDLAQSAVVRVIATHTYDEIMAGIAHGSITHILTKEVRRELRQFGVHVARTKLVDFADCRVYHLIGNAQASQGQATFHYYE